MKRGSENHEGNNIKFFSLAQRGFVQRVEEGTEGSIERKLEAGANIGNTVHEMITNQLIGRILKIEKKVSENTDFGDNYNITIDTSVDGNAEKIVLSTKQNSNPTRNLLKQLLKADMNKDVKFTHKYEEAADGYKYGSVNLGVIQEGDDGKNHFVGYAHTNAAPNGLPAATTYVDGEGKSRKSYLDQNKFLEDRVNELTFQEAPAQEERKSLERFEAVTAEAEDEDDLPF
jgi:hypothetical protein